jgi:hypothetical protein
MPDDSLESHRLPISIRGVKQPGQVPAQEPPDQSLWYKALRSIYNDTGNALPGPAIAVSPESAPLFANTMKEAVKQGEYGKPWMDAALSFLKLRYPRFANQVPIKAIQFPDPQVMGQFGERSNTIFVDPDHPLNSLHGLVKTLSHEMVHARQFKQQGAGMLDEIIKGVPYDARVIEQQANQGMDTARRSFNKLLDLLDDIGIQPHNLTTRK